MPSERSPKPAVLRRAVVRFGPALLLAATAGGAYASGLMDNLSLDGLAARQAAWAATAAAHPIATVSGYVLVYAVLTGACLPVAMALTLTAGLILGPWIGGGATAVGGTAAALLTYFAARSALAPWVLRRARRDPRLGKLVHTLSERGFWFLLSLRLMPVMPFAVTSVAAGAAGTPLPRYVAATFLAAIPTSLLYASLGSGVGASLKGGSLAEAAHSPQVLLPLLALGGLALASLAVTVWRGRAARAKPDAEAAAAR